MATPLRGRQTQFYIDLLYGVAFALGFGYLLAFGLDARVAAFEGGLVLGYFLRVLENMQVYERILEEEVASEAEERVEAEVEETVPEQVEAEVEETVPEEIEAEVEERVPERIESDVEERVVDEVEERVEAEVEERVADEVESEVSDGVESQVADEVESQVADEVEERIVDGERERLVDAAESALLDRIGAVDEELAERLREHLRGIDVESDGSTGGAGTDASRDAGATGDGRTSGN
jgi:hypothetical protein